MNHILETYKGKRVLVTGHTGFKGSWLSLWLHILGAKVTGYALAPKQTSDHFSLLGLENIIQHNVGDIRDFDNLNRIFEEAQPEIVFHLAAQPLVRQSYQQPKYTFDTNIGGTVNILEAVRLHPGVRSLVCITSDKCYKNKEWIWGYRENDELGGSDPYSASKASAELVYKAYLDSYFTDRSSFGAASVRAGNVIGGGDWSLDRIVPDCIRALSKQQPIVLRNPHATRPWQHVLEPLSGYLLLGAKIYEQPKEYQGSYNFGPNGDAVHNVGDLAKHIVANWGGGSIKIECPENAVYEAGLLHLNCDKARFQLNWRAQWDFQETVRKTVSWYKGVLSGNEALPITQAQIEEYMEALK